MILLLTKYLYTEEESSPRRLSLQRIQKALEDQGLESKLYDFQDISISLDSTNTEISIGSENLEDFSFLFLRSVGNANRDLAYMLSSLAQDKNIPFIDTFNAPLPSVSKIVQGFQFSKNSVSTPKTYFSCAYNSEKIKEAFELLGSPLVIKEISGALGKGVYKVSNEDEAKKILDSSNKKHLFQEFLEKNQEYRILVLGGKAGLAKTKKSTQNDFRNTSAFGAEEEIVPLNSVDPTILRLAEKAANSLSLEISGVDVATDMHGHAYVLEANKAPGFINDDESPEFIALAKYIHSQTK